MATLTYQHYYVRTPVTNRITEILDLSAGKNLSVKEETRPELIDSLDSLDDSTSFEEEKEELSSDGNPQPAPGIVGLNCKSYFYVGFRLNTLLYGNKTTRNSLGFYFLDALPDKEKALFFKFVRNRNNVIALDFVSNVPLTLKAVDPNSKYEAWGVTHRTHMLFSNTLTLMETRKVLYNATFKIGKLKRKYKVIPNSIVMRHSRKSRIINA